MGPVEGLVCGPGISLSPEEEEGSGGGGGPVVNSCHRGGPDTGPLISCIMTYESHTTLCPEFSPLKKQDMYFGSHKVYKPNHTLFTTKKS